MWRKGKVWYLGALTLLLTAGCAKMQPTPSEVAGRFAPPNLKRGRTPAGGANDSETGGGAGGSAAAGVQFGRVGGIEPKPITPAYAPGRMAPNGADGSGTGDRGVAVPPDKSPVFPNGSPR